MLDLFTRHWDTIKVNGYILLVHACGTLWETKSHGTVRLASGIISVRCSLLNTPQVVGTLSTIEVVPLLVIYALTVNIYIYISTSSFNQILAREYIVEKVPITIRSNLLYESTIKTKDHI